MGNVMYVCYGLRLIKDRKNRLKNDKQTAHNATKANEREREREIRSERDVKSQQLKRSKS